MLASLVDKAIIMKTRNILFAVLFCFILGGVNAQDKTAKAQLAPKAEQSKTEVLLNSKTFEFIANTMYPMGQSSKNLVGSDYSVTFSPEMIISNMPFYGRSYSAMAIGKDKGMRFKGAPEDFTVEKIRRGYEVKTTVKNDRDTFSLLLTVSDSGYATLSISTNNRETISYHGEVR